MRSASETTEVSPAAAGAATAAARRSPQSWIRHGETQVRSTAMLLGLPSSRGSLYMKRGRPADGGTKEWAMKPSCGRMVAAQMGVR